MSKKLWGGRFKKKTDKNFEEFSRSIHYDYRLAEADIKHSLIHVLALRVVGLITEKEAKMFIEALSQIEKEIEKGEFKFNPASEDIHTEIHNRVAKKVGALALKLHSLRSRNDQVVFDEKEYCYNEMVRIWKLLREVIASLDFLADRYKDYFIPGYTHTRRAQVVAFRDYIEAFSFMFMRDADRTERFLDNLVIYIGAGALAGSGIPQDAYEEAINTLVHVLKKGVKNFKPQVVKNSLDNVASRDFLVEVLSILSIIQMHLSRLAEDFILYSTREFHFIDLPEEFCTGSSLMPHKKNPDFLELVRGYSGRIYGNLVSLLTVMKGLPLTYNRDMQLDKESLFSSLEIIRKELEIVPVFLRGIELNTEKIKEVLKDESLYATELAEYLTFRNVPFKKAHAIVGKMIRYAEDKNMKIKDMPDHILKRFHKELNHKIIREIMRPEYAVSSKKSVARRQREG